MEAVENALSHGVYYIELDLDITSDSLLIATHGWEGLDTLIAKGRPSIFEFKKAKVHDQFTTLSYLDIDSVMNANPNLNLVTDKISDPYIIDKFFCKYKERVWVECFCDEDYFILEDLGYHVLRTGWPPTKTAKWTHLLKRFSYRDFRVRNYTFAGADNIDFSKSDGDCFAIFGGANISIAKADSIFQRDPRIRFVYVDFLE